MEEVKSSDDLRPLSRQVLLLLDLAQTTAALLLHYLKTRQDTFLRNVKDHRHNLWRFTVTGCSKGCDVVKKVIFLNIVLFFFAWIVLAVLMVCLLSAMGSTVAFRHYMLRHIPGSHVVPLELNGMPFYTEWWRNKLVEDAALEHLPLFGRNVSVTDLALEKGRSQEMIQYPVKAVESAYADLKFSHLNRYRNSVLATSTMYLSTGITQEVFLPGGEINSEAIFHLGPPLFNAKAQYSGKMQLVFLREDAGRDMTVVVESTMMLAEDAHIPQPLSTLDVFFRKYVTHIVRTGEAPMGWPKKMVKEALHFFFYVPLKGYQILQRMYAEATAPPFPRINHAREVSLTVTLYERFTPPLSLQSRLRAMNITVYQSPEEGSSGSSQRLKLLRMTFYSFLELHGVVGWLVRHPVVSFLFLTLLLFVAFCGITFLLCTGLGVALYRKFSADMQTSSQKIDPYHSNAWNPEHRLMRFHERQRYIPVSEHAGMDTVPDEIGETQGLASSLESTDSFDSPIEAPRACRDSNFRKEQ